MSSATHPSPIPAVGDQKDSDPATFTPAEWIERSRVGVPRVLEPSVAQQLQADRLER